MLVNEQPIPIAILPSRTPRPSTAAGRTALSKPPISLLGIPFDPVTLVEAVDRIGEMIESGAPHQLVTPNVDFLVQAQKDVELRRILINADLVLCDGTPLVWASRWFGNPLPERVAGADLVPQLLDAAVRRKWRVYFLGGAPEVTARAVTSLKARLPGLTICGHHSPPFRPLLGMDHEDILDRIRVAKPDLLLVSFGCPKAEKWIAMHKHRLGVPVSIGVGATIDFLAGQVQRAPVWARQAGLEWLFRMAQEPRRLGHRYARDLFAFTTAIAGQTWHLQAHARGWRSAAHAWPELLDGEWEFIEMPQRLDARAVHSNAAIWERGAQCHLAVDLAEVRFIDSTGVGLLLWLRKVSSANRRHLFLVAPSPSVRRALTFAGLSSFFRFAESAEEARQIAERDQRDSPAFRPDENGRLMFWRGEITAANVDEVWLATRGFLQSQARTAWKTWIDLAHVHFLDSAGAALMDRVARFTQAENIVLSFTGAPDIVIEVLRTTGLLHLLEDRR